LFYLKQALNDLGIGGSELCLYILHGFKKLTDLVKKLGILVNQASRSSSIRAVSMAVPPYSSALGSLKVAATL
jgi:hypothetical protein